MTAFLLCVLLALVNQQVMGHPLRGPPGPPLFLGHPDPESSNECRTEVGLTSEERETKKNGELTEKELCFIRCLGQKNGALSDAGVLHIETIKNDLRDHLEDSEAVIACLKKVGTVTTCQHIKKVAKCYPDPKEPMDRT
ncbi:hypothetical protein YQE_00475, partial [Dendroctonus ponderosae]